MSYYSLDEFSTLLTRTFALHRPRIIKDVDDKGKAIVEFILPNPTEPRFSISLQINETRGFVETCSLWFGQAEISGYIQADMVAGAIQEIIEDHVVAILRYKNQDAYDDHRPSGKQWLYQLTDDEDDESAMLEAMRQRLLSSPTLMEKISGKYIGVFEIFSWTQSEVISR